MIIATDTPTRAATLPSVFQFHFAQHVVARLDGEVRQRLASALPLGCRELEEVASQGRKAHAVVDSPKRPGSAGFLYRCGIEHPDLQPAGLRHVDALFLKQGNTQGMKPVLGLPEPFHNKATSDSGAQFALLARTAVSRSE